MPSTTDRFGFYKVNPTTDGDMTFNIKTMINDNLDAIESKGAKLTDIPAIPSSLPANGGNSTTVNHHTAAATPSTTEQIDLIGMTNEVKNEVDTHLADNAKHLPSGGTVGQIVQKQSSGWGLVDLPPSKDVDNGRYQSVWGLDDAVLNGCILTNTSLQLGYINPTNIDQTQKIASYQIYGNRGVGQKILSNFITFDAINYIDISAYKMGTVSAPLSMVIYDYTSSTVLATISVPTTSFGASSSYVRFQPETPIPTVRGHILHIRLLSVGGDISNSYYIDNTNVDVQTNANLIYTTDAWNTITDSNSNGDLTYKLNYSVNATSGTATKTVAPSDIKKWGNVKFNLNIPTDTNVACLATYINETTSSATQRNIPCINGDNLIDLSSVSAISFPKIQLTWTLSRNSISDPSPTVSNASVTWEGQKSTFGEVKSSAPNNPQNGQFYYDSTFNKMRFYINGAWV